ncbi:unnamed protein product [Chrysodeixis includens]|uniref:Uncharacterized protein n=1 Tax=Chrysodeixis includens TaxID=689277 RepID=A0A9N8KR49_CHRIL|nr:unnamed protein product [Chrysodeixis includens]
MGPRGNYVAVAARRDVATTARPSRGPSTPALEGRVMNSTTAALLRRGRRADLCYTLLYTYPHDILHIGTKFCIKKYEIPDQPCRFFNQVRVIPITHHHAVTQRLPASTPRRSGCGYLGSFPVAGGEPATRGDEVSAHLHLMKFDACSDAAS